ncbi:hypothetical protein MUO_00575 [Listeria monocytogenes 07PF0776]|nr:hypothetical protein MUO_00575 [Listeria monocytogenes 07PF0776]
MKIVNLIDLLKKESNTKMRKKLMTKINHMNNKLIFENQEYPFEYPIQTLREDKNHVYVLLDIPANQNIRLMIFIIFMLFLIRVNGNGKYETDAL